MATLLHLGAPQSLTFELLEKVDEVGKCKSVAQLMKRLGLDSSFLLWSPLLRNKDFGFVAINMRNLKNKRPQMWCVGNPKSEGGLQGAGQRRLCSHRSQLKDGRVPMASGILQTVNLATPLMGLGYKSSISRPNCLLLQKAGLS